MAKESKHTREQKKQIAKDLFLSQDLGMTQKEIADVVGVSEVTISNWATAEDWATHKNLSKGSKQTSLRNLYLRLARQTEDDNCSSDEIKKTTSAIQELEDKRNTIPDKIELFKEFIRWLRTHRGADLALIKTINQLQNENIQELIKQNVPAQ